MKRWLAWAAIIAATVTIFLVVSADVITPDSGEIPKKVEISSERPKINIELLNSELKTPTAIEYSGIPGDERVFVAQQNGIIRAVNPDGSLEKAVFGDISDSVKDDEGQGLVSMTFDPEYSQNGFVYLSFIEEVDDQIKLVIARYTVPNASGQIFLESERRILEIDQPFPDNNGGDITFGPDGLLYISTGDGGKNVSENKAQDITSLLGKILRVDVTGESYQVPSSNPFISVGGVRPEIIASGLRNPWKISVDNSDNLWIGDRGVNDIEEINVQPGNTPGTNFGWDCFEGQKVVNTEDCSDDKIYQEPAYTYGHSADQDCPAAVTGGRVYEGTAIPNLRGYYVFGDFCSGEVFALNTEENTSFSMLNSSLLINAFGVDHNNELYIADYNGSIYRVVQE